MYFTLSDKEINEIEVQENAKIYFTKKWSVTHYWKINI